MKIYVPSPTDGYELCHPLSQDNFESIIAKVNGVRQSADWKPVLMRLIRSDEGRELLKSDSPWLGPHALIFREDIIDALGNLLRENGELLPLDCKDASLKIFNPIHVIDALDEDASSVLRFSGGSIMRINRHEFKSDVVSGINVFKIPNLRASPTFVGQAFVDKWNSSNLAGLDFKEVWAAPNT